MKRKTLRLSDLRLGWLEAFVAVAERESYKSAASVLGIDPTNIEPKLESLQSWLHRVLVMDGVPIELAPDGLTFLPVATEILREFDAGCATRDTPALTNALSLRKSARSSIGITHFEALRAIAQHGTYKKAAFSLSRQVGQVRYEIQSLERVTGYQIVRGNSYLRLTDEGQTFLKVSDRILDNLLGSRAKLPMDYDPFPLHLRSLNKIIARKRSHLAKIVSIISKRKRLSKEDRFALAAAQDRIGIYKGSIKSLLEYDVESKSN